MSMEGGFAMSKVALIPSILTSVKKNLGIPKEITAFDPDIILHINSVFAKLSQLGVGPSETFMIEDDYAEWDDFDTNADLNLVRSYMFLEVRMLFDPPTASVLTSMEKKIAEYEWRLNVAGDELTDRTNQNGTTDSDDV